MRFLDRMRVRVFVIGMLKKNTYRRCVDGEKNAFGTDGCFWHLKGGCVLNSCPIGLIRFSSISSFDVAAYMKHGIACKIETRLAENNWKMQNASPTHIVLCWQTIEQMKLLPFRGRFHGFEWRERNSVCQQFQPKCTQWWTEWNYVRSGMRIVAVETSIWVATLIRFPIWIAKCTWWFQLALASLNHPSETKKRERERKMRLLLFIAFHFHLFQTSVFHSIPFCVVWALKMVFWVHLLIYGTYRQWWRKCRKRRKERCASASTLLPLKRSS